MPDVLLLVLAVLALLMENAVQLLFGRKEDKKLSIGVQTAYFAVLLLPAISLLLPHFSLPLFLCAYLSACVLQQRISPLPNGKLGDYGTIRFLIVGSVTLFIMGAASLIQHDVHEVCSKPAKQIEAVFLSLFTFAVLKGLEYLLGRKNQFSISPKHQKDFRYMRYFLYMNVTYVLLQSVMCRFYWMLEDGVAFLLCSNLISVILFICYSLSLIRIFHTESAERSHLALNHSLEQADVRLQQLRASAHYDKLTGAYSRLYMIRQANHLLNNQMFFSLVYIDLNGLKKVNDKCGHQQGDEYLCQFVQFVQHHIRTEDILARVGGDEFVLLLLDCTKENAEKRMQFLRKTIQAQKLPFLFAAGIVDSSQADQSEKMLRIADGRMYQDKQEGRHSRNA